ncbi:peptide-binding protein [Methylobacterium sp. SyP6R]|uniref:peptide-binding protein n=1 Tax=Methylobacterium sp. SyP6R TaxID=2718876 RepID=UPI001F38C052|nr:peptide-binding protein [Methylobacterium sp. SyP6R]MCF4126756.1 peptide-binding protein [Methylobacterium sp. SyP6R]
MRTSFPSFTKLLAALLAACTASCHPPARKDDIATGRVAVTWPPGPVRPVTLPLVQASHRWLIDLVFLRPDGSERRALAWVNLGMPSPVLSRALFRDLGLDQGCDLAFRLGAATVRLAGSSVVDGPRLPGGQDLLAQIFAPRPVEAVLPAGVLRAFAVALDPAAGTLTLGLSGSLPARGVAVPVAIVPESGLVTAEAAVANERLTLVLDPGASYTWLRGRTAASWRERHPNWERAQGAVGRSAIAMVDLGLEQEGTVLRLPEMALGPLVLPEVGALATGPLGGAVAEAALGEIFWDTWQKPAGRQVDGWLGNNVLGDGRLTIDYAAGWARFERQRRPDPNDLDGIGLTLVRHDEGYAVGRVVTRAGFSLVDGAAPGDVLRRVDGRPIAGLAPDAVLSALSGRAGTRRRLDLERDGVPLQIEAEAASFR